MPKPDKEFRIFILGGSNVECFFVDNGSSINAMLQQKLNQSIDKNIDIKVYSAGKSGITANEQISILAHNLVYLQPDMILYNTTAGEMLRPQRKDNIGFLENNTEGKLSLILLAKMLVCEFQIGRYLYAHLQKNKTARIYSPVGKRVKRCQSKPICDDKPTILTHEIRLKLRTVIGIAKVHQIPLVFITQPSAWKSSDEELRKHFWISCLYDGKRYSDNAMASKLREINDIMLEIASEQKIMGYDMVGDIPQTSEYFYDDLHYNTKGAQKVAGCIAEFIMNNKLI